MTIPAKATERPPVQVRFGGWHDGDNHKPGRGWYAVCRCGHIGRGQLLPQSAMRQWEKHRRRCEANTPQPYSVSDREARENADQHDLQRELK